MLCYVALGAEWFFALTTGIVREQMDLVTLWLINFAVLWDSLTDSGFSGKNGNAANTS